MMHRSNRRSLLVCLLISIALAGMLPRGSQAMLPAANSYPLRLVPDQLVLAGDVATRANTVGRCPEKWFAGTPAGTIMLGIDPTSCDPNDWNGGTARLQLPAVGAPTLLVMTLSWVNLAGKGLHSPDRDRTGTITLDNRLLWSKRTTQLGTYGDYYAADRGPIRLTIVLSKQSVHTLEFKVPARTAWDLSQIEISEHQMPNTMHGVAYSPFRDCQAPDTDLQPSEQDVADDLFQLAHTSNAIRTYASTGVNGKVPSIANSLGLPIYAGAWIDDEPTNGEPTNDPAEVAALIDLARKTKLAGAIVGSEYYLRHQAHPDSALAYLEQQIVKVKQGLVGTNVPITTAETDSYMFDWENDTTAHLKPGFKRIVQQLDFILIHIYPFWNGHPIDGAAQVAIQRFRAMQAALAREHLNKRLIIGETGWPSRGLAQGAAVPSLENQRRYLIEFLRLADQQKIDYMYFEPFDELWKGSEGTFGQNWGYGYNDRTAKHDFFGVLLPIALLPTVQAEQGDLQSLVHAPSNLAGFELSRAAAQGSERYYLPLIMLHSVPFVVFEEWPAGEGNFVPSGFMGDPNSVSMFECDRSNPHGGDMAVRATFTPTGPKGWGGVYWQYPENNWGDDRGGKALRWANKATFWAKGAKGGEKVNFFVGGIGGPQATYPDSVRPSVSSGFIQLGDQWQQYTINLTGQDLSRISGGFGWSTNKCANPQGATFFVDDIQLEYDPQLPPPPPHGARLPVYTDAAAQDNHFVPSLRTGDGKDENLLSFTECWLEQPHSGETSIKVAYSQGSEGWGGQYWVHPEDTIGDLPGGIDLTGANRLTFWARSDTPDAQVKFLIGGVGYETDYRGNADCAKKLYNYADSLCPPIAQEEVLSPDWRQYTIDLHQLPQRDLSKVVGGFGWVAKTPVTFYLDDIVYEFD